MQSDLFCGVIASLKLLAVLGSRNYIKLLAVLQSDSGSSSSRVMLLTLQTNMASSSGAHPRSGCACRAIVTSEDPNMEGQEIQQLEGSQDDGEGLHHFLQQEVSIRNQVASHSTYPYQTTSCQQIS